MATKRRFSSSDSACLQMPTGRRRWARLLAEAGNDPGHSRSDADQGASGDERNAS